MAGEPASNGGWGSYSIISWIAFARTGRPTCDTPDWPRYSAKDQPLMEFGATAEVRRGFRQAKLDAHEALMPSELAKLHREFAALVEEGF